MAAGGVCAPVVIPLREFTPGSRATKNVVDEKTPIELFSDSKDAVVYYTINGEKPEPFQKFGKKSTFKYLKPFSLPVGKRTVRTIAVNSHGQTSSAVTKVFLVNPCKDEEPPPSPPTSDTISLGDDSLTVASLPEVSLDVDTAPPHSGTQILRSASRANQRICLQCSHPLPNVEDARFCPRCGFSHPSLTDVREPVTPTNFAYCQRCRAVVPKKMSCCPSCHSPMGKLGRLGTIVAQKDLVVEDGVTCDYCGTTNPPDCHMCVTCERNLTPLLNHSPNRNTYPLVAFGSEEYHSMCSACGRVNSRDARYCDWCGSHAKTSVMAITCKVCSMNNDWQSQVCASCNALLEPDIKPSLLDRRNKLKATGDRDGMVWYPVVEGDVELEEVPMTPTSTRSTQTEGIFYKSSQTIQQTVNRASQRQHEMEESKFGSRKVSLPLLEFSPGSGYWRQQIDHITQHLKVHAANSQQFKESIGFQQMGKLVSTEAVDEDGQLKLCLHFETKNTLQSSVSLPQSVGSTTTTGSLRQSSSVGISLGGSSRLGGIAQLATTVNKSKKAFKPKPTKQTVENYLLVEELSANGKGRVDIVTQLIEQGGSVNAASETGCPVVCLAARHGRCEALTVLLKYGAPVNATAKNGNTALHEAVLTGDKDCIELLLKSGSNVTLSNKAGDTAMEVAQQKDKKEIVKLIASHVGSSVLQSLLK